MSPDLTAPADFDPIAFLERAVRTPSHESVGAMRELVVETLADRGVAPRVDAAGNVVATRGGDAAGSDDADGPHYVLNTHLDTVRPGVPFERTTVRDRGTGTDAADGAGTDGDGAGTDGDGGATSSGDGAATGSRDAGEVDAIAGRGACDAKGPLAAMLAAFLAVDPGDGRVTLALTPDEETLSTGAHALATREGSPLATADGVIVGEPTGLDVCTGARGRFEGTVTIEGEPAHAASPGEGDNAVLALRSVLEALRTFDAAAGPDRHPDLGGPTLVPTVVEGGEASNRVPARAQVTVDRRSVPPETAEGFRTALVEHLRERAPSSVEVSFAFTDRETPFLEAFATDRDDPLVGALAAAVPDADGRGDGRAAGGEVRTFGAATEASYFADRAPTVVFGPGVLADDEGAVAHAEREYVPVPDVRRAAAAIEGALSDLV